MEFQEAWPTENPYPGEQDSWGPQEAPAWSLSPPSRNWLLGTIVCVWGKSAGEEQRQLSLPVQL